MYFLIYGADNRRSRQTLAAARDNFSSKRDPSGLNVTVYRSGAADPAVVLAALVASPFLAEKKLVILEGFLRSAKTVQERLIEALEHKPDSTVAIFFEEGTGEDLARAPLFPLLRAQRYTVDCPLPTPAQLLTEARAACQRAGLTLAPRAAQLLLALVGTDPWRFQSELEKLCAFAAGSRIKVIDETTVKRIVTGDQEASIFAFLDASTGRSPGQAVAALEGLYADGAAELQIIAGLSRHLRTLLLVHNCLETGLRDRSTIAKTVGIHPFVAGKAQAACRFFSRQALIERYLGLLELERALKSGESKGRARLTLLTHKLTPV